MLVDKSVDLDPDCRLKVAVTLREARIGGTRPHSVIEKVGETPAQSFLSHLVSPII